VRRGARRGVLPTLDLTGGMSAAAVDSTFGASLGGLEDRRSWSIGVAASYPLFNRRDRGLSLQADLDERLGEIGLSLTESLVRMEVRAARRALAAGAERMAAAGEAAELARAQLAAEQQRLDLGLGDSFRLLQTEEIAAQAELAAVRARYDAARAAAAWRLAIGTGDPGR
jgi:outer membrane protein TolC